MTENLLLMRKKVHIPTSSTGTGGILQCRTSCGKLVFSASAAKFASLASLPSVTPQKFASVCDTSCVSLRHSPSVSIVTTQVRELAARTARWSRLVRSVVNPPHPVTLYGLWRNRQELACALHAAHTALHSAVYIAEGPSKGMERPRDLRGGSGTSWKIACAVGRDLSIGQLAELLVRDRLLQAEVRAAMERAPTLPWDSRVPRIGTAPRHAPGAAQERMRPAALPELESAPERAAEPVQGALGATAAPLAAAADAAASGAGAPAIAPKRGVFGRRAASVDDGGLAQLHALIADRLGGAL